MDHAEFSAADILFNLLLVFLLVFLNGFFVAAEFALVKIRQSRLTQLVNEGSKRAQFAASITQKLDTYLSASQFGITLSSLGLGWVGEPAVSHMIVEPLFSWGGLGGSVFVQPLSFAIAFAVITFLHIVLGELAPKSLAIQKSESVALFLAGPLILFYKIFFPAIWLLNAAANRMLRIIGIQLSPEQDVHTQEELRILVNQSAKGGKINQDEMVLFDNIFEFSDRLAREVMLPRTDMDCLFAELSFAENLRLVYQSKHTRYPVAVENKDNIIGFVHITDLLTADPDEEHELRDFVRPVLAVPESMEISHVLKLMQKRHSQLAIVVDEYGGTAGMVTTEDILEEIVGEIHDEFEDVRPSLEMNGRIASVDGRMLIEEMNEQFNLDIDDEEVDSIGGWLFKQLEGSPAVGDKVQEGGMVFEVAEIDRLRIVRVLVYEQEKKAEPEQPEPEHNC
ncbi:hemolysin family protein [Ferviditalea candida]|uniref:Hemolysin family protein n=1 Tax=Ferviditalea candida TaxID=3108399 RepID=A0ABU5ZMR9_9BACL|nr:hemolysin family protein [Paenibacillaceae bacterium T2]